jgi:hypothetical protein
MATENYWFGRRAPEHGITAAWGARAIFASSMFQLLPDRQSWSDGNADARSRLKKWVNEKGLVWLRSTVKGLSSVSQSVLMHDEGDFHIEASPQQSGGYLYIGAWERTGKPDAPQTLAAWKARFQVGTKLRCSFRWHTPNVDETVTVQKVQTNAVAYDYLDGNRPAGLKPGQYGWMYFPKRDQIRFTTDGFELLKPDGTLMSRYHWL